MTLTSAALTEDDRKRKQQDLKIVTAKRNIANSKGVRQTNIDVYYYRFADSALPHIWLAMHYTCSYYVMSS